MADRQLVAKVLDRGFEMEHRYVDAGTGSYHLKAAGQAAYATLVSSAMAQWLPAK